jgi:hypothetical protein
MSRIEIILSEPAQTNAYKALLKQDNQLLRSEFAGPVFADAKYKFNSTGLEVHADGNIYYYPTHSIARAKIGIPEDN